MAPRGGQSHQKLLKNIMKKQNLNYHNAYYLTVSDLFWGVDAAQVCQWCHKILISKSGLPECITDGCVDWEWSLSTCYNIFTSLIKGARQSSKSLSRRHAVDNKTLHSPGMARLRRVCATRVYYLLRNELCVQNGILFTGDQIIILIELRVNITTVIHASNPGEEAWASTARRYVYWKREEIKLRVTSEV